MLTAVAKVSSYVAHKSKIQVFHLIAVLDAVFRARCLVLVTIILQGFGKTDCGQARFIENVMIATASDAAGATENTVDGTVSESWAEHHHRRWYERIVAGKARQRFVVPGAKPDAKDAKRVDARTRPA